MNSAHAARIRETDALARRGIVEHLGRDDSVEPDSTPMPAFLDEGT